VWSWGGEVDISFYILLFFLDEKVRMEKADGWMCRPSKEV